MVLLDYEHIKLYSNIQNNKKVILWDNKTNGIIREFETNISYVSTINDLKEFLKLNELN